MKLPETSFLVRKQRNNLRGASHTGFFLLLRNGSHDHGGHIHGLSARCKRSLTKRRQRGLRVKDCKRSNETSVVEEIGPKTDIEQVSKHKLSRRAKALRDHGQRRIDGRT